MSSERPATASSTGRGGPARSEGGASVSGSAERRLKDAALAALALPWTLAFGVLGRVSVRRPARWSSPGGLRVLVVAPHPDDEVAGCAGTLLLHRGRGDRVTVAHATDGGRSRALGLDREEMVSRRRREAERAVELLEVAHAWIGLPEGDWQEERLVAELRRLLRETDPHLVYAPSLVDFHLEHRRVASSLAAALDDGAATDVRIYEVQVPLTDVLVSCVSPTGAVAVPALRALEAYRTQLGSLRRTLRAKRYLGLRYRAGRQAEAFWEVSAAEFRALHAPRGEASAVGSPPRGPSVSAPLAGARTAADAPGLGAFRGLRRLPLTDPLAYLAGREERRRLAVGLTGARSSRATPG